MLGSRKLSSLYDCIRINGDGSYRELAKLYKTSATSIYRKIRGIKGRSEIKGAAFFESEEGQEWIIKMVVGVILVFGIMCKYWNLHRESIGNIIAKYQRLCILSRYSLRLRITQNQQKKELQNSFCGIKKIKENLCILDSKNIIDRSEREVSDVADQIDIWWNIANNSLASSCLDNDKKEWLLACYFGLYLLEETNQ